MATVQAVLDIARSQIGYSRWTDKEKGSRYGRWYAELTGDSEFAANGVPYCAMYVSWVFNQAGQEAPGLPGAYCPWIVNAGKKAGQTVPVKQAQPGDIVLFDWGGDGVSDHVGIVEANNGSYLTTIEGNTSDGNNSNGGMVLRRTRAYSTVICVIRPIYTAPNPEQPKIYPESEPDMPPKSNTVYRLFNPNSDKHLFTSDPSERDALVKAGWTDEGAAWTMPMVALGYRVYNPNSGDHLLCKNKTEADALIKAGWTYEGIGAYGAESGKPVHRLFNPHNGDHIYTTDDGEYKGLKGVGWSDEGVEFYAL